MRAGRAELHPGFCRPIAAASGAGPRPIGELLQPPEIEGKRDRVPMHGCRVSIFLATGGLHAIRMR
jgi:hypothetical protein